MALQSLLIDGSLIPATARPSFSDGISQSKWSSTHILSSLGSQAHPFVRYFRKRPAVGFEMRLLVRVGLPPADHHIHVLRFDFYDRRAPLGFFAGDQRRSGPAAAIQNQISSAGAISNRAFDQAYGFHGGVQSIYS